MTKTADQILRKIFQNFQRFENIAVTSCNNDTEFAMFIPPCSNINLTKNSTPISSFIYYGGIMRCEDHLFFISKS